MNPLFGLHKKEPRVEFLGVRTYSPYVIESLHIVLCTAMVVLAATIVHPPLILPAVFIFLVIGASFIKEISPALLWCGLVAATLMCFAPNQQGITWAGLLQASLLIGAIRTYGLLKFSDRGVRFERAVVHREGTRIALLILGVWGLGGLALLISNLKVSGISLWLVLVGFGSILGFMWKAGSGRSVSKTDESSKL